MSVISILLAIFYCQSFCVPAIFGQIVHQPTLNFLQDFIGTTPSLQSIPSFPWNASNLPAGCSFGGIKCDSNFSIVEIDFDTLPDLLTVIVPASLCDLPELVNISLTYNYVSRTPQRWLKQRNMV
jgi:hypothetical protein